MNSRDLAAKVWLACAPLQKAAMADAIEARIDSLADLPRRVFEVIATEHVGRSNAITIEKLTVKLMPQVARMETKDSKERERLVRDAILCCVMAELPVCTGVKPPYGVWLATEESDFLEQDHHLTSRIVAIGGRRGAWRRTWGRARREVLDDYTGRLFDFPSQGASPAAGQVAPSNPAARGAAAGAEKSPPSPSDSPSPCEPLPQAQVDFNLQHIGRIRDFLRRKGENNGPGDKERTDGLDHQDAEVGQPPEEACAGAGGVQTAVS